MKQCFRCYNYGHIGTQCNASQLCGYCAEQHETKHCRQKGAEGFTPRCTVCKGAHTAWSNACPARRKEMRRVEQAKTGPQYLLAYPREREHHTANHTQHTQRQRFPGRLYTSGLCLDSNNDPDTGGSHRTYSSRTQRLRTHRASSTTTRRSIDRSADSASTQQPQTAIEAQAPFEVMTTQAPAALSVEEDWERPATQQEPTQ